jgi:hypothetical protein
MSRKGVGLHYMAISSPLGTKSIFVRACAPGKIFFRVELGLTVDEYFSLTDEQRDALWEKWEQETDKAAGRMTTRVVWGKAKI